MHGHDMGFGVFIEARNDRNGERMLVTVVDPVPVNVLIRVVDIGKVVSARRGVAVVRVCAKSSSEPSLCPTKMAKELMAATSRHSWTQATSVDSVACGISKG